MAAHPSVSEGLDFVVDRNPHKHGKYTPIAVNTGSKLVVIRRIVQLL